MLALSATGTGALVGLALGVVLSLVVALGDGRRRRAGTTTGKREYTASLALVPLILAGVGALAGLLVDGVS